MASKNAPIDTPPRAPSPAHKFATLAVHAGAPHDPVTGAVIEPVRCPVLDKVLSSSLNNALDLAVHDIRADVTGPAYRRIRIRPQLQPQQVSHTLTQYKTRLTPRVKRQL